jgi:hypothetical protein
MIVWQDATNWHLSPFINDQVIPLRTPPPLWNVPQPLFINEEIVKDFTTLLFRQGSFKECVILPPVDQISVIEH